MGEAEYVAGTAGPGAAAKMFVISGCSGGGKSALLEEMSSRGYLVYPEPGRQIVKEQLSIAGEALPWKDAERFIELCLSRAMYFYNMSRSTGKPVFFDRSIVDSSGHFGRMGLPLPAHFAEALRRYRYATKVFVTPPWRELFSQDEERRHSFADAEAEYWSLLEVYPANGYEVVLLPKVGVSERADFLERQLKG